MSTRTNRERLLAAMEEVERGETAVREWPQQETCCGLLVLGKITSTGSKPTRPF